MKKYVIEFELENTVVLSRNNTSSFQVDNDLRIEVDTPYKISNLKISEDKEYPEQYIKDLKIELLSKLLDGWGINQMNKYKVTITLNTEDNMLETLVKIDTALSHIIKDYNLNIVED